MGGRFPRSSSWQAYPFAGAVPLCLTLGTLAFGHGRSILLPLILLGGSIAGLLALFLFWFGRKKESTQTGSEKDQ